MAASQKGVGLGRERDRSWLKTPNHLVLRASRPESYSVRANGDAAAERSNCCVHRADALELWMDKCLMSTTTVAETFKTSIKEYQTHCASVWVLIRVKLYFSPDHLQSYYPRGNWE
jgi:hypothetical protein